VLEDGLSAIVGEGSSEVEVVRIWVGGCMTGRAKMMDGLEVGFVRK